MKQLVILSGKGGTGKTSVAAAFASLAHSESLRAVLADADVDAANLELVLHPRTLETHDFVGGSIAVIDPDRCDGCGVCASTCRFDAIEVSDGVFQVDGIACDGCAACVYQCPAHAIDMEPQVVGRWFRSESRYGPLFHAALRPAQENSGKLVTLVKQQARLLALDEGYEAVIVDGPPGIGCPVISAVSGADVALIATEPTVAGIHDLARAIQTTKHFHVPTLVCINKADIHPAGTAQIEAYCGEQAIPVVGQIPFDESVTEAMIRGEPVTAYHPEAPASRAIRAIWQRVSTHVIGGSGNG
ncbi:MAG: ATP-binding protein [Chloroflexi bacterium]|nr:ATP-binding protein [Chloroflexota bacterium]